MSIVFRSIVDPSMPGPLLPDPGPERRRVDATASDGTGARMVLTLDFLHLTDPEFETLAAFHARHAPDQADFLWRDSDGRERRVRFAGPLESQRRAPGDWGVRVTLASVDEDSGGESGAPGGPDAAGACFVAGGGRVDWPAPLPERRVEIRRRQAEGWSAAGIRQLQDGAGQTRVETLAFSGITDAQRAALENFFACVGGSRDAFSFSEPPGLAQTVRFADTRLAWVRLGHDRWRGEIALARDWADN